MIPFPGGVYDHKPGYRWLWVYLGWDGINRVVHKKNDLSRLPEPSSE